MVESRYVEPVLLGYMFFLYSAMTLSQQLVYRKTCIRQFNTSYCHLISESKNETLYKHDSDLIQKETSQWIMYLSIIRTIPAVISTLVCTAYFDRVGRKRIMIMPIIGATLVTISDLANSYYLSSSIVWMFFGAFLDGLFGQFASILASAFAYLADTISVENRTRRVILLESMVFLGGCIAEIGTGQLLQHYGFLPPFIMVLLVLVMVIIYWFFLRESYPPTDGDSKIGFFAIIREKLFKRGYKMISDQNTVRRRKIILLWLYFFIALFMMAGSVSVLLLFILRPPISFSPANIGFFLAEAQAIKFIGSLFANYILIRVLGWTDNSILLIYGITSMGFYLSLAFSSTTWHIYLLAIWNAGTGLGAPAVRGKLSKMFSKEDQGVLFSLIGCIETSAALVAGPVASAIYKSTVSEIPNAVFFIFTGCAGIITCFVFAIYHLDKSEKKYEELNEEEDGEESGVKAINS
eukprot:TCONS_00054640-protein